MHGQRAVAKWQVVPPYVVPQQWATVGPRSVGRSVRACHACSHHAVSCKSSRVEKWRIAFTKNQRGFGWIRSQATLVSHDLRAQGGPVSVISFAATSASRSPHWTITFCEVPYQKLQMELDTGGSPRCHFAAVEFRDSLHRTLHKNQQAIQQAIHWQFSFRNAVLLQ
jgi:hypothetical protein